MAPGGMSDQFSGPRSPVRSVYLCLPKLTGARFAAGRARASGAPAWALRAGSLWGLCLRGGAVAVLMAGGGSRRPGGVQGVSGAGPVIASLK